MAQLKLLINSKQILGLSPNMFLTLPLTDPVKSSTLDLLIFRTDDPHLPALLLAVATGVADGSGAETVPSLSGDVAVYPIPAPGGEVILSTFPFALYLGPKDMGDLEKGEGGLGRVLSFGFWDPIAKPMLFILKLFYKFIPNYGLAIIFLSVLIKVVFWPLTHKGQKSMKEMQKGMQKLQPKLAELKEKYKNNKDELNRRTMELYRTHKVNPLGGCLPLLIQFPVFIALYRVLLNSIELRHAPFVSSWINDLAAKDPTYISPLIMGASMFIQQKMTPTAGDPAQAKMMLAMPIVFTFLFLNFPSGLVIYWLVSNVLSISQQYYINKYS